MATLTANVIGSAVLVLAGFILSCVGIFSPAWVEYTGLFQTCFAGTCTDIKLSDMEPYFKAVAAMEILAFLTSLVCLAGVGVHLLFGLLGKSNDIVAVLPSVAFVASFVEGGFAIIGCIIFAAKTFAYIKPDYAFFLTIIGAVFLIIGCVMFKKTSKSSEVGGSV